MGCIPPPTTINFSVDIMKQLVSCSNSDTIILATGDSDLKPAITEALVKTHNIEIWSFKSGKIEIVLIYSLL